MVLATASEQRREETEKLITERFSNSFVFFVRSRKIEMKNRRALILRVGRGQLDYLFD